MATDEMKILQHLLAIEKIGQDILSDKSKIIMLDKRRNSNREALRALQNSKETSLFTTIGSVPIKTSLELSKSLLEADQKQLNIDINKIYSDLKVKVNDLRDLEMLSPVPGLDLVPLSKNEKFIFAP